jgi:leucyl/phenylalanyl-tRNA--protein transferase
MELAFLDNEHPEILPDPQLADSSGLVAVSTNLGTKRLVAAYQKGIFPWVKLKDFPHYWCWYSPNPRMLLYPHEFKLSRSLKKTLKQNRFEIKIDQAFPEVMRGCATAKRPQQESTWIEPEMEVDYTRLHYQEITHSVEAYWDNQLVGGLYGLAIGRAFFGESMFHRMPEASKVCMHQLVEIALIHGIDFIDCQVSNPFLKSLGAREVSRIVFLRQLENATQQSQSVINWGELAESSN